MALLRPPVLQTAIGPALDASSRINLNCGSSCSRSASFSSSASSHGGVGWDHSGSPLSSAGGGSRQSPRSPWRHVWRASQGDGSNSSPEPLPGDGIASRSDSQLPSDGDMPDSSRRNGSSPKFSSLEDRQDTGGMVSKFNREDSSGGGRQDRYASASPGPDARRNQGNGQFSSQQRPSGGGRGGGPPFSGPFSGRSEPWRSRQGSNSNRNSTSNFSSDSNSKSRSDSEQYDVGASTGSDSRKNEANDLNSYQRSRQAGNKGERAARDGLRGWDARTGARTGGQGRGKVFGRGTSSKPSPSTSNRQGRRSSSSLKGTTDSNAADVSPLFERLKQLEEELKKRDSEDAKNGVKGTREKIVPYRSPYIDRLKRLYAELEKNESKENENSDGSGQDFNRPLKDVDGKVSYDGNRPNSDSLGPDSNTPLKDVDGEVPYDGKRPDSAMSRIVEKLSNIPGSRTIYRSRGGSGVGPSGETSVGLKYGQPMFPAAGRGWSTPDNPVPTPGAPTLAAPTLAAPSSERFPWENEDTRGEFQAGINFTRARPPSLAELTLPEDELKRLKTLGALTMRRIRVGKAGVTHNIVEAIHNEWRESEVARVKCEGPSLQDMKRTHEILEEKTGGFVVWRAGGACLVYRGKDYVPPQLKGLLDFSEQSTSSSAGESQETEAENEAVFEDSETEEMGEEVNKQSSEARIIVPRVSSAQDLEYDREMDDILSTLGPRYEDWTGRKPIPVDADLLVDPNLKFKKPFRQFPYGVKPSLTELEITNLRRLARPIPPQFILGVNKGLDGLAAAIVKLWERSEIAKVAVKRGFQNTNHERMAVQLKLLTGGILISRDKYFIVLYRGKDFLPPAVAAALEERHVMATTWQEEEEKARSLSQSRQVSDISVERSIAGTLAETLAAKANWSRMETSEEQLKIAHEVRKSARRDISRRIQRKVDITLARKERAELELQKVERRLQLAGPPLDRETITDEEKHMYSKLGLKMRAFLLLGRRGVFDGTVENMHLHWKYRPLVKVIYKARDRVDLAKTARMLEYESGGILVATIPTNKGQAIIVYRGKNYQRPPQLRPRTLLSKREALKRSIEMQRHQSLTQHLLTLEGEISKMKADLSNLGEEEGEEDSEVDDEELNEERDEPTASGPEGSQKETNESTISEFESVREDDEVIDASRVGNSSKLQSPDLIYRAEPLSRRERLILRQLALKGKRRVGNFNVGCFLPCRGQLRSFLKNSFEIASISNPLTEFTRLAEKMQGRNSVVAGLARAIRIHFRRYALVKIGVKGRAGGTPVQDVLHQLEEATGGTLVSQEHSKAIFYRGWPEGQEKPTQESGRWEELPAHLRSAMITEVEDDDDYLHESDWEVSDDEDNEDVQADLDGESESFGSRAAIDDSTVDDDSDWDEFEGDGNDGYLENGLDSSPEEQDDDEYEAGVEKEHVRNEVVLADSVESSEH